MTIYECAERLGVSAKTLEKWIDAGLPYFKIGIGRRRFIWESVIEWLHEQEKRNRSNI